MLPVVTSAVGNCCWGCLEFCFSRAAGFGREDLELLRSVQTGLIHLSAGHHRIILNSSDPIPSSSPREKEGNLLAQREPGLIHVLYKLHLRRRVKISIENLQTVLEVPCRGVGKRDPSLGAQSPRSVFTAAPRMGQLRYQKVTGLGGSSSLLPCAEFGEDLHKLVFSCLKVRDPGSRPCLQMLKAVGRASLKSTGWGSCKLLPLDVFIYLPNNLSKVFPETLPFRSLPGDSSVTQLAPLLRARPCGGLGNGSSPPPHGSCPSRLGCTGSAARGSVVGRRGGGRSAIPTG